jgi:hypothetical protein
MDRFRIPEDPHAKGWPRRAAFALFVGTVLLALAASFAVEFAAASPSAKAEAVTARP